MSTPRTQAEPKVVAERMPIRGYHAMADGFSAPSCGTRSGDGDGGDGGGDRGSST
ncbi:hypothetical protein ACFVTY_09345 [Streptomyces sp. NPDC058067]|uniref:hypothetical protein n=1 Tax=Streptomyces sp. NPDC058067 TaxID=3346324 RepID=UPI0036EA7C45